MILRLGFYKLYSLGSRSVQVSMNYIDPDDEKTI
jgi:hypothetical protein